MEALAGEAVCPGCVAPVGQIRRTNERMQPAPPFANQRVDEITHQRIVPVQRQCHQPSSTNVRGGSRRHLAILSWVLFFKTAIGSSIFPRVKGETRAFGTTDRGGGSPEHIREAKWHLSTIDMEACRRAFVDANDV